MSSFSEKLKKGMGAEVLIEKEINQEKPKEKIRQLPAKEPKKIKVKHKETTEKSLQRKEFSQKTKITAKEETPL